MNRRQTNWITNNNHKTTKPTAGKQADASKIYRHQKNVNQSNTPTRPRPNVINLLDAAIAASRSLRCSCCNAPGRYNCCFLAFATLLLSSWTLLLRGLCNAPVKLLDTANVATATSWPLQRCCKTPAVSWPLPSSCNARGRCNCCFLVSATLLQCSCCAPRNCCLLASVTLLDGTTAATATSWSPQRSCDAPGSCNCYFQLCNAPRSCNCCVLASATLLQSFWKLLLPALYNAPVTLLGGAADASATS